MLPWECQALFLVIIFQHLLWINACQSWVSQMWPGLRASVLLFEWKWGASPVCCLRVLSNERSSTDGLQISQLPHFSVTTTPQTFTHTDAQCLRSVTNVRLVTKSEFCERFFVKCQKHSVVTTVFIIPQLNKSGEKLALGVKTGR